MVAAALFAAHDLVRNRCTLSRSCAGPLTGFARYVSNGHAPDRLCIPGGGRDVAVARAGRGAVSRATDQSDRCVYPGRPERRAGAHPRQEARATARPAIRDREPARRRRQYRRRAGRACGARRLHAADGQQQHPRHQCEPLPEDRLRCREGLCADQPDRLAGEYPGGQPRAAGAHDGRADRACESKARPARLCLLGLWRRRAPVRRIVQGAGAASTSCMSPTRARRRRCRM